MFIRSFACLAAVSWAVLGTPSAWAQDEPQLIVRPEPPALDDLETDEDGDQKPDRWYNLRDVTWEPEGGMVGPHLLRFQNDRPGRPARASKGFGVHGGKYEAMILGLWIRFHEIGTGERVGEDPGVIIEFLDEDLKTVGRGTLGPWTRANLGEGRWVHVARKILVPPTSRDALMSVGLMGSTGTLEVDGLSVRLIPVGGESTENLVLNGDVELVNTAPAYWGLAGGAEPVFPGYESNAALELPQAGARVQLPTAVPLTRLSRLMIQLHARTRDLRGGGGALATLFFLDTMGRPLSGTAGSAMLFRFSGSEDWRLHSTSVRVPAGAQRAVLQVERTTGTGTLAIDNVSITADPEPNRATWIPDHVSIDTEGWAAYKPSEAIEPDSALDASALLAAPKPGRGATEILPLSVHEGHLTVDSDIRKRLFGVALLPPLATLDSAKTDVLVDNLARRGVNLVRLVELDAPYGPARSLIDDTPDNTATLDPDVLVHFDHLVAALSQRGIYLALDLNTSRRFRAGDAVPDPLSLPPGGGPATGFDQAIREHLVRYATNLLTHVNPETNRALKDEPALAWVTICGEQSLFNLLDDPDLLSETWSGRLRAVSERKSAGSGTRLWQALERDQWDQIAQSLRSLGLKSPIAGNAHWRREADFGGALLAPNLDLIDDVLFWPPPRYAMGDRFSLLFDSDGGLHKLAAAKRKAGKPYVVSQWCSQANELWACPMEAADLLLTTEQAHADGWDALCRRGIFLHPNPWGAGPPGTRGSPDLFRIPEVINANPAVFAMLPHAASLFLKPRPSGRGKEKTIIWDPGAGRATIDTPHTAVLSGRPGARGARLGSLTIESDTPTATIAVSALGNEPISTARRLLITAIARVEPTGHTYADRCLSQPGLPGTGPLLLEPVDASVAWKRRGTIKAFALDNAGHRAREVELESTPDGVRLVLDNRNPGSPHWELLVEEP